VRAVFGYISIFVAVYDEEVIIRWWKIVEHRLYHISSIWRLAAFTKIKSKLRDRSLFIPGVGTEEIWVAWVIKFLTIAHGLGKKIMAVCQL
jgi:hypothetical protein